ncbi:MAG: phosphate ABC transporter substrate-binding protein [Oscillospiraceae bacterium]|nr:phosphate ABC transporter substrate-binding protein [Oscillospiraceae bacterium]
MNVLYLKKAIIISLLILSICLLPSCRGAEDRVIAAGSTSVQPYAEILAEEFALAYPDTEIDIQGGGSAAGITAAQSGTAEIGMSSRALKDDEKGLWVVEIAKDGLAVIINPANAVSDLTLEQIRDIYTNDIVNWGEVDGSDAKIHIIAREEGSGTRSAFEDLVMGKDRLITPKAIIQGSNGTIRQLVAGDPNAIGFISLGLVDGTVKALRLGGVEASKENVISGSYKLFRPFLFLAEREPEGPAKQFIDFALSEEGQRILSNEGLIPE